MKKKESEINSILYFIKLDFSLIYHTLKKNSDYSISFIKLIKNYNLLISKDFEQILRRIHEGDSPETELLKIISPSKDFNQYIKELIINNFDYGDKFDSAKESRLEKNFRIHLREIQSKISIIFFIGVFFPIGLCFLILFQLINLIILLIIIPFFLYLLHFLSAKFVHKNSYLIGFLNDNSNVERKKFEEFLIFLKGFAMNLRTNISPEKAFLKSYIQNKSQYEILMQPIKSQITRLLNFNCSFNELIQTFKLELKSTRYNIILDAIEKFIFESAELTSDKIVNILNILNHHQKLERKLKIIIKGEKFKIFFFIFLLPILIGIISGMFPFFIIMTRNINTIGPIISIEFNDIINIYYIFIISFVFISSISITSNNFLNIINFEKKFLVIFISNLIFILTFISSFLYTFYII